MPLYEYRCGACENVYEYMQTLSERPKRKCEDCGGRLEKLVSRAGFVLKGTGWYETDFKAKKPASKPGGAGADKADTAEKASKPASETKSATSSDSKKPASGSS